jgi:lipopolysaccharide/colanic/teichoic acid biosynthesis glycosyltransferase
MEVIKLPTRINTRLLETATVALEAAPLPNKPRIPKKIPPPRVEPLGYSWYPPVKAAVDFVAALLLLVVAGPLLLLLAALVKLTSRGPAFYSQLRLGRHGKPFTIYKLRTMIDKCESLTGPRWSIPGDPRVTPLGWFLRKSHLDELPQLINVLKGEMALIGPRPERPEFLPELQAACPRYRERLAVRPGVTGLAQVQLPADTNVQSVRRKLAYDLYYIQHLSPWLDLSLLACTAFYAMGVPFRLVGPLLRVPTGQPVEATMRPLLEPADAPARNAA